MTIILSFSDGDAIPFESRFNTLDKAFGEALARRFIEYDGKMYLTTAIVKAGTV